MQHKNVSVMKIYIAHTKRHNFLGYDEQTHTLKQTANKWFKEVHSLLQPTFRYEKNLINNDGMYQGQNTLFTQ